MINLLKKRILSSVALLSFVGLVPAPPMLINPYELGAAGGALLSPYAMDPSLLREVSRGNRLLE